MSVVNPEALCNAITTWIEERLSAAGAKTAVVGLSGGADSALVALLCARSTKFKTVCVRMPCQSSPSSLERANELAEKFGLTTVTVDLKQAFECIWGQAAGGLNVIDVGNAANGALRSCLRAPTLDFVGKLTNGLIVGTGNRDEDEMTRYFQKRGDGSVDISPIAKLHKSEVYELLRYLGAPQSIIDAVPTADLWGPDAGQEDEKQLGMTYQEVEWAIRECDKYGFQSDWGNEATSLATVEKFRSYTDRQVQVLKTIVAMEKSTRHKAAMPPVFDPRTDQFGQPNTDLLT